MSKNIYDCQVGSFILKFPRTQSYIDQVTPVRISAIRILMRRLGHMSRFRILNALGIRSGQLRLPIRWTPKANYLNSPFDHDVKRRFIQQTIQNNPEILRGSKLEKPSLKWRTVFLLIASSSSLSMLLFLTVQVYKVKQDTEPVKPRSVFLPLWLSFDWPYKRRFAFPKHLQYMDPEYFSLVGNSDFLQDLHRNNVHYQVLDGLFRLSIARDIFGFPLLLRATESDTFEMWIEPKYPTVHGPEIDISKVQGKIRLEWNWSLKLVHCWSLVDSVLTGLGVKLDRLDEALVKTHEKASGRVHEVLQSRLKVPCGDRDYNVLFKGTFKVSDKTETQNGTVGYTGVIDFNHLGINSGVRVVLLELTVVEEGSSVVYKLC